jgi:hypothetical protein
MAITTGGGVAFDQNEVAQKNRGQLLQAQQALQQQGQFTQQQALQTGAQKFLQAQALAEASGDPEDFYARGEGRQLLDSITQDLSVASGRPLTAEQARQAGLGMAAEYYAKNPSVKSMLDQNARAYYATRGQGAVVGAGVEPGAGKSGSTGTATPVAQTTPSATAVPGASDQMRAAREVVFQGFQQQPPGYEGESTVDFLIDGKKVQITIPASVSIKDAPQYAREELIRQNLMSATDRYTVPQAVAPTAQTAPAAPAQVPYAGGLGVTPGAPASGFSPGFKLPTLSGQAHVADTGGSQTSPISTASGGILPQLPGQGMGGVVNAGFPTGPGAESVSRAPLAQQPTGTPLPGGTGAQTVAGQAPQTQEELTAATAQFSQSIQAAMPGLQPRTTEMLTRIATPGLEARPTSATPKQDAKAVVKQTGLLEKAFTGAQSAVDKIIAGASAREPGTDMIPLTQRDKKALADVSARTKAYSERLREENPGAIAAIYKDRVKWIESASPMELEAAGLTEVASRSEALQLANIAANAGYASAMARGGSQEAAALMDTRVKLYAEATKVMGTLSEIATREKLTMVQAKEKYPALFKSFEEIISGALDAKVSLETVYKHQGAISKWLGFKPTAEGLQLGTASGGAGAVDQSSIDALIQSLSQ